MSKKKQIVERAPLIIALLFLFNPNIAIIDLLPDFVGYILLCVALSKISDLNDTLRDAYTMFKRMIFIDAGKILAVLWIFGMTVPSERNTSVLLWTFIFSVVELICLIPAYTKLFDGIANLGYLLPNDSVLSNGTHKKGKIEKVKGLSIVFIIVKAVMCVLPEFADLTNTSYDETASSGLLGLYDYIGLMRTMAFIPVIILGIIWLVKLTLYFNSVLNDKIFMEALYNKYCVNVLPKAGLFVRRNFKLVTVALIVASCLTIDFRIDSQNIFPDFLAAAVFVFALVFLQRRNGAKSRLWIWSAITFSYASILSFAYEFYFFSNFYYGAIIRSNAARAAYALVIAASVLKSIAFIALLIDIYKVIRRTISAHTGYVVGMERSGESEARLANALRGELKKNLIYVFVAAILYMVSDICYACLAPIADFMGLINIVFALIFIALSIKALLAIQHAIDTKYMLE